MSGFFWQHTCFLADLFQDKRYCLVCGTSGGQMMDLSEFTDTDWYLEEPMPPKTPRVGPDQCYLKVADDALTVLDRLFEEAQQQQKVDTTGWITIRDDGKKKSLAAKSVQGLEPAISGS